MMFNTVVMVACLVHASIAARRDGDVVSPQEPDAWAKERAMIQANDLMTKMNAEHHRLAAMYREYAVNGTDPRPMLTKRAYPNDKTVMDKCFSRMHMNGYMYTTYSQECHSGCRVPFFTIHKNENGGENRYESTWDGETYHVKAGQACDDGQTCSISITSSETATTSWTTSFSASLSGAGTSLHDAFKAFSAEISHSWSREQARSTGITYTWEYKGPVRTTFVGFTPTIEKTWGWINYVETDSNCNMNGKWTWEWGYNFVPLVDSNGNAKGEYRLCHRESPPNGQLGPCY